MAGSHGATVHDRMVAVIAVDHSGATYGGSTGTHDLSATDAVAKGNAMRPPGARPFVSLGAPTISIEAGGASLGHWAVRYELEVFGWVASAAATAASRLAAAQNLVHDIAGALMVDYTATGAGTLRGLQLRDLRIEIEGNDGDLYDMGADGFVYGSISWELSTTGGA